MKKISKILIPVASTITMAAPATSLTSCTKNYFFCNNLTEYSALYTLESNSINVKAGKSYRVTVNLSKFGPVGTQFRGYILYVVSTKSIPKFTVESTVTLNKTQPVAAPVYIDGTEISDNRATYTSISFNVVFDSDANNVWLIFFWPHI